MSRPDRTSISLRVPVETLAEIDRYAEAAGVSRSEYLLSSALARGRGGYEAEDALRIIRLELERAGVL